MNWINDWVAHIFVLGRQHHLEQGTPDTGPGQYQHCTPATDQHQGVVKRHRPASATSPAAALSLC